ncbi:nuclear transport factor 2 family protein [Bradyrhizobium sp. CCGUVB14]|uniref:nuclear transport factor 2 family protein n=1 Tax=Bradyrhizobium sp. CCGUVB14 TaxID=2949628 RepID=UPI0020B2F29F|nr:nuclear transport factor 2 family protein [Bradyrhizobium sp. CCGUVB14]MCP3447422.1 nuclear transport factor 2 family protein [Bradyrhizobium sp. CCGUVB14]
MGHREDMLDVIKRAYAARGAGDVKGLVATFHPEGSFNLIGDNSALHLTGSVQGQQPLLEAFGQFIKHFAFEKREILSEVVEGNHAVVRCRLVVRYHPSGKVFSTEVLDLFRFQDGKIIELIEYADTALVKAIIS